MLKTLRSILHGNWVMAAFLAALAAKFLDIKAFADDWYQNGFGVAVSNVKVLAFMLEYFQWLIPIFAVLFAYKAFRLLHAANKQAEEISNSIPRVVVMGRTSEELEKAELKAEYSGASEVFLENLSKLLSKHSKKEPFDLIEFINEGRELFMQFVDYQKAYEKKTEALAKKYSTLSTPNTSAASRRIDPQAH